MNNDNNIQILIESDEEGLTEVGFMNSSTEAAKKAINASMGTISWIAKQAFKTIDELHDKPDEAEIEFGIKVESEAGKLVMKAGASAHINVRLVWKNTKESGDDPKTNVTN